MQVAVEIGVCEICNTPYNIQIRQGEECVTSPPLVFSIFCTWHFSNDLYVSV